MEFIGKWHLRAQQAFKEAKQHAKDVGGRLTLATVAAQYNILVNSMVKDHAEAVRQHITPGQLNHWLRGRRSPRLTEFDRLCKIMKWPPETILFGIATKADDGYVKKSEVAAMVTSALQAQASIRSSPLALAPPRHRKTAKAR
jgi:hypothetical protein